MIIRHSWECGFLSTSLKVKPKQENCKEMGVGLSGYAVARTCPCNRQKRLPCSLFVYLPEEKYSLRKLTLNAVKSPASMAVRAWATMFR